MDRNAGLWAGGCLVAWRTGIPAVAYLLGYDPGPGAHRGDRAGVTVYSCPAAPRAQERAPRASRLRPRPSPRAPLWKGGRLRATRPRGRACRVPTRRFLSARLFPVDPPRSAGSTLRSCPFLPLPAPPLWGGPVPRAGERARGTGGGRGVGCAASRSVWGCPPGAGGTGNACAAQSAGRGPSRPSGDEVTSCSGRAGRAGLSLAPGDSHDGPPFPGTLG